MKSRAVFGETMPEPQIFHWREPISTLQKKVRWLVMAVALVGVVAIVWTSPLSWATIKAVDWYAVWQKMARAPDQLIRLALCPVFALLAIGGPILHKRRARLTLNERTLSYRSGLPVLQKWLDWTLDLDAIRSKQLTLRQQADPRGMVRFYCVTWGPVAGAFARQLRPFSWYLPGQPVVERALFEDAVFWPSARSRAALQDKLQALPLVQALLQRGIELPHVSTKPATIGMDLMVHARMRAAVYGFFSLLLLSMGLLWFVRDAYYFAPLPQLALWIMAGGAGAGMLVWLWGETPDADTVQGGKAAVVGFRATQVVLAALVSVAAGLCAPSLPLAYAVVTQASREQVFALQKQPQRLLPDHMDAMPAVQLEQAAEYWQSLPEGAAVTLPVRRGAFGLWWQFDAAALREKWQVYYQAHP
jgi:hypothetical protein